MLLLVTALKTRRRNCADGAARPVRARPAGPEPGATATSSTGCCRPPVSPSSPRHPLHRAARRARPPCAGGRLLPARRRVAVRSPWSRCRSVCRSAWRPADEPPAAHLAGPRLAAARAPASRRSGVWRLAEAIADRRPRAGFARAHLRAQRGATARRPSPTRRRWWPPTPARSAGDWFNLAFLLEAAGRDAEAEPAFRRANRHRPEARPRLVRPSGWC